MEQSSDSESLQATNMNANHTQTLLIRQKKTSVSFIGIGLALLSGLFFSTMALFAKLAVGIPAFEVAFSRSFIAFFYFLPLVLWFIDGSLLGPKDQRWWLCARGVTGVLGMSCGIYGVKFLPLGDATVLIFMTPIFTGVLSRLTLKEPWGVWQALASLVSLVGVVLIARPAFLFGRHNTLHQQNETPKNISVSSSVRTESTTSGQHALAVSVTLIGALLTACAYVIGRKVGQRVHFLIIGLYFSGVGVPIGGVMNLAFEQAVSPWSQSIPKSSAGYLFGVGLSGVVSFCCLNKALALESAAMVALVRNVNVIIAYIYQMIFFGNALSLYSGVGTVLILSSTGGVAWLKYKRER